MPSYANWLDEVTLNHRVQVRVLARALRPRSGETWLSFFLVTEKFRVQIPATGLIWAGMFQGGD